MVQKEFTITNQNGLHTRPGNDFVKTAKQFSCAITLTKNGIAVDGKSLLKIMKSNIVKGDTILLTCDGEDEVQALEAMGSFLASLNE
ncbi:HPr family phosphocarrier protein [Breznakiella homolactica]|uniref:Phosphocarrier protein HPr n=1 Tax=Breznakiella homolactica TaxID=2798577 RepID=A0A7T7XR11_9SPIR|nr:HPr family phosphocarrier protein [Breznakiella homolactica]QQO10919.1 HPr family phosphocarrier protein [Breznakiella homolactica]